MLLACLDVCYDFDRVNTQCLAFRGSSNTYRVLCADSKKNKFIMTNDDKNIFGSYYHVKVRQLCIDCPCAADTESRIRY